MLNPRSATGDFTSGVAPASRLASASIQRESLDGFLGGGQRKASPLFFFSSVLCLKNKTKSLSVCDRVSFSKQTQAELCFPRRLPKSEHPSARVWRIQKVKKRAESYDLFLFFYSRSSRKKGKREWKEKRWETGEEGEREEDSRQDSQSVFFVVGNTGLPLRITEARCITGIRFFTMDCRQSIAEKMTSSLEKVKENARDDSFFLSLASFALSSSSFFFSSSSYIFLYLFSFFFFLFC